MGGWRHAYEGRVDWRVVAWMAPPSVAGAVAGALLGGDIPDRALYAVVAAVLAWNGIDLLARPVRGRPREEPRLGPAVGFGFAIGVIGGAIGVILGTLRMPALLRAVGLTAATAVGTNLVIGFFLGLAGAIAHATQFEIDWGLLAAGLVGAIPGAWLGANATGRLSETALRRAIGAALLIVAAAFAVQVALA
jgi:hypothetical protein